MNRLCSTRFPKAPFAGPAALGVVLLATATAGAQWPQWGGPNRDFKCATTGLTDTWPDQGPKRLWTRDLGEGYSGIVVDDGRLFTMYRADDKEIVVAMDAPTGRTVWEHAYDAPVPKKHVRQFGAGPRGAPLVVGKRVYTVGVSGILHCLSRKTGRVHWSHKLLEEFDGTFLMHGYASSPLVYKRLLIVPVGGKGHSFVALNRRTGRIVWKRHDFANSYSSPIIINVDGQDQLVCFMGSEVVGLDPLTGDLRWRFPHENRYHQNICMPVWGDDHILFITSVEGGGSRGLRLTRVGDETRVEELWHNPKVKVHHTNAIRVGDYVYTSTGGRGPALINAINVKTGELAWRERGFAKATLLYADGRFILLDEDGNLALARATPEHLTILSKVHLLDRPAWTVPTLVGHRLYLRDKKVIMALDLG